ncbi:hypothetical protein [Exiguobacterium sp. s22]|uniref:hypothetical protein n=1 Tax=Exiguobacterium sp. s22 TaxID=2751272 RepID=UPI001BE844CB|nr:hypothetical protein [Exiguobacterium sp. s22]
MKLFAKRLWESVKSVLLYGGTFIGVITLAVLIQIFAEVHPRIAFWVFGFPMLSIVGIALLTLIYMYIDWLIIEPIKQSRKER